MASTSINKDYYKFKNINGCLITDYQQHYI